MERLEPRLRQRILHWILDEEYILESDIERRSIGSTTCSAERLSHEPSPSPSTSSHTAGSTQLSTAHSSDLPLVGCENDILIPTDAQINTTFTTGHSSWSAYLRTAGALLPGIMPACCLQPSNMLGAIPPLPENIRGKQEISGHAIWNVPCPELQGSRNLENDSEDEPWDPEHVSGAMKTLLLRITKPTICGISPERSTDHCPDGLAVLTLCWLFVFSARLLEMQHRRLEYSKVMSLILTRGFEQQQRDVVIFLGCSSKRLVRWLCAILAPGAGWVIRGSVPPWTAHFGPEDVRFVISTDHSSDDIAQEAPPSSAEATDLILELCSLYDFGSQPTEAFLTALLFPFCAKQDLQPRLPRPQIPASTKISHNAPTYIYEYLNDLRYYMTLSLSVGSAIWSIFWESGIQSNVASAWLGAIHEVLRPLLESANVALLAKVFAIRNAKLAPLWLGFLRCGSSQVLEMISRYLTTHQEDLQYSLGFPDLDVAIWTGSKQSFLDEECSAVDEDPSVPVSTADILRHRLNFGLADKDTFYFGWQPPGVLKREQIELELWPRLESPTPSRSYKHWVWWLGKIEFHGIYTYKTVIEKGYLQDRRARAREQSIGSSSDVAINNAHTTPFPQAAQLISIIKAVPVPSKPSIEATRRILRMGAWEASGDRTLDAMGIPGLREHQWLKHERDL